MSVVRSSRFQGACLLVALAVPASAQTAVVVRPAPRPDHKTVVTTTQELSIAITGMAAGTLGKLVLDSKGALTFTRMNGVFDDQGRMEAQMTVERFETSQSLNGAKAELPRDMSAIVGRSVTAVFDRADRLIDVRAPADLKQMSGAVRQVLVSLYAFMNGLPEAPMRVGDTVTATGTLPIRLPGPSGAAAPPIRTMVTLRRIDDSPAGRIAYLDQLVEAGSQATQIAVTGKGTIDVNLDKGFVAASVMNWTVAGSMPSAVGIGPAPPQPAQVQATLTISLTATE